MQRPGLDHIVCCLDMAGGWWLVAVKEGKILFLVREVCGIT